MHHKRYSVFISSTFEDLKDERRSVQDVLIGAGDFPVQMESFPAADEDQFAFIRALIDQCDYYVLIVGGRYGAVSEDGLSYTEKEYRYAVSAGVPILVLLHGDRGSIPISKSESTDIGRQRLERFVKEVQQHRLRKSWTSQDELKLAVREALDHAKTTKPGIGWVRGDTIASMDALEELNHVRKENEKFRNAMGRSEFDGMLPPLPSVNDKLLVVILPNEDVNFGKNATLSAVIEASWMTLFPIFHDNLVWHNNDWNGESSYHISDSDSCIAIGSSLAAEILKADVSIRFKISSETLRRLKNYYIEIGLMNPNTSGHGNAFTEIAEKVARRYTILGVPEGSFSVVQGELSLAQQRFADEEIPF